MLNALGSGARWCSGQAWGPLEPLTGVRISPGLLTILYCNLYHNSIGIEEKSIKNLSVNVTKSGFTALKKKKEKGK
jgi:hypothetical protein